jgi:hypothetical protein
MNLYWNSTELPKGLPFEPWASRENIFFWMRKGKPTRALSLGGNFAASGGPFAKSHHTPAVRRIVGRVRSLSRSWPALGERLQVRQKAANGPPNTGAMARGDGVLRESDCLRLRAGTEYQWRAALICLTARPHRHWAFTAPRWRRLGRGW